MGYIFVLASFVPPQSGGMIPFSYKHYHHDITSRYDKILVVVGDQVCEDVLPLQRQSSFEGKPRMYAAKWGGRGWGGTTIIYIGNNNIQQEQQQ